MINFHTEMLGKGFHHLLCLIQAQQAIVDKNTGQLIAYGALQRTESRGAHYRADYPQRNDCDWMRRTLATWSGADADLPTLNYEDLDVMAMELPPGWRGYGARDYIEHPATQQREQQIEAILARIPEADRHLRQEALMPFKHTLPEHLRGNNQRLGEE